MFGVAKPTLVGAMMIFTALPAFAADIIPDPIPVQPAPAFGGWYLRGHIGMTNQALDNLDIDLYRDPSIASHGWHDAGNFDSSPLFGAGIGYQFNEWFRADVTAEYRGKSDFRALDWINFTDGSFQTNEYGAQKSEWLIMANAYVDLGTWWNVTPFIGAGVGAARVTIANYTDNGAHNVNYDAASGGYYLGGAVPSFANASAASQWNLAWAVHAGLAYRVNPNLTLELAYSYVNLGKGTTGPVTTYTNFTRGVPMEFHDITSHDVKFGVRWSLNPPPVYLPPPPLVTKG